MIGVPRRERTTSPEMNNGRHLLLRQHAHLQVERREVGHARLVHQVRRHDHHIQATRIGCDRHGMQFLHGEAQRASGGVKLGGTPHPTRVTGTPFFLALRRGARRDLFRPHLRARHLPVLLLGGHREARPGAVRDDVQIAHPHAIAASYGQGHRRSGRPRLAVPAAQHLSKRTARIPRLGVMLQDAPAAAQRHRFGLHHLRVLRQRGANNLRRHQTNNPADPTAMHHVHHCAPFASRFQ